MRNSMQDKNQCEDFVYSKRLVFSLIVLSFPIVSFFLLSPVEVYYANIMDFEFVLKDFCFDLLAFALGILCITSSIISIMKWKSLRLFLFIIFSLSTMFYIQNMFLNIKLSNADGAAIDWSKLNNVTNVNLFVWMIFAVLFVVIYKKCNKYCEKIIIYGSSIFSFVQMCSYIFLIICIVNVNKSTPYCSIDTTNLYSLASEDNTIIIVLDSYSNERFYEACLKDDSIDDGLKDFTCFSNYDSKYKPTFPSMMYMITQNDADTSMSKYEWTEDASVSETSNKFFDKIRDAEYVFNLYSKSPMYVYGNIANFEGKICNLKPRKPNINHNLMVAMMVKYALFKYSPYVLKPKFEVDPEHYVGVVGYDLDEEYNDSNLLFYSKLKEGGLSTCETVKKQIQIIHLRGVHSPQDMDENAEYKDNADIIDVARGCHKVVDEYLNQMKKNGLYDSSNIIIMADHGESSEKYLQPILFIKRKNEMHNEMQYNNAPVYSEDIQATIIDLIGLDYSEFGTSVYDWSEDDNRERIIYNMDANFIMYKHSYDGKTKKNSDYVITKFERGKW